MPPLPAPNSIYVTTLPRRSSIDPRFATRSPSCNSRKAGQSASPRPEHRQISASRSGPRRELPAARRDRELVRPTPAEVHTTCRHPRDPDHSRASTSCCSRCLRHSQERQRSATTAPRSSHLEEVCRSRPPSQNQVDQAAGTTITFRGFDRARTSHLPVPAKCPVPCSRTSTSSSAPSKSRHEPEPRRRTASAVWANKRQNDEYSYGADTIPLATSLPKRSRVDPVTRTHAAGSRFPRHTSQIGSSTRPTPYDQIVSFFPGKCRSASLADERLRLRQAWFRDLYDERGAQAFSPTPATTSLDHRPLWSQFRTTCTTDPQSDYELSGGTEWSIAPSARRSSKRTR